jgi:maltose alpha-D-glucosyltransferase/alpha-amylase
MDRLARHIKGDNLKLAFAFLLSMPGAPFIYYGDEIGMNYVENLVSVEGGYGRTGSRSPMQWDSSTNAGFSSAPAGKLYIPLDPSIKRPTVQAQQQNKKSLYHEIQKLIKIRQEHKALQSRGQIEFVFAKKNEYPLAYVRSSGEGEKILVIINPSEKEAAFSCDLKKLGVGAGTWTKTGTEIGAGDLENAIYSFGGKICFDGKKIIVAGKSAGFFILG